jgi:hypothetical protein
MDFEITLPDSWKDITIDKYIYLYENQFNRGAIGTFVKLYEVDPSGNATLFLTPEIIDKVIHSLSLILELSQEEVETIGLEDIYKICKHISFFDQDLFKVKTKKKLIKPFNLLNVGEWVNIEESIRGGLYKNYKKIASTLVSVDDKTSVVDVYQHVNDFLSYRKGILKTYESLFIVNELDVDDEQEGKSDWSWFGLLFDLAGGDFLKMHQAAEMNFIGALNFQSYKKSLKK